ncbi:MAG TPA: hypothetical protein VF230_07225 [Acidimicrobiales bacterium]
MKSVEVPTPRGVRTIELHDDITVVRVGGDARAGVAEALAKAFGAPSVVRGDDLPRSGGTDTTGGGGDGGATATASPGAASVEDAEAAVAAAEAALEDAQRQVAEAERAYSSSQDSVVEANRAVDREASDGVNAAEARLEVAQAGAAAARLALDQARAARDHELAEAAARDASVREAVDALHARRTELEAQRDAILARLGEVGAVPDSGRVEEALEGLRRLRQVKPKPSARGTELAEEWAAARRRLAELPTPPGPPEWLVTPALAALQDARAALAKAEATAAGGGPDPELADAVERAHREVLEAEQRVMRKGSRLNKRRLEQAQESERAALQVLGVASYGEYLQQVAPSVEIGDLPEDRVAAARASLADAEAVWEELHGGQASPEYTEAKAEEARVRAAALELLEEEVPDDRLEEALRAHLEAVVDTGWAAQALVDAMHGAGVAPVGDVESGAEAWLASLPEQRERRAAIEEELGAVDTSLAEVDRELSEVQASAFFGDRPRPDAGAPGAGAPEEAALAPAPDPLADHQAALDDAESAEREAEEALAAANQRAEANREAQRNVVAKEQESDRALAALDEARRRRSDAEAALEAARTAATAAASAPVDVAPPPVPAGSGDGRSVANELWLLARLVAARAAGSGSSDPPPVVVEAGVATAARARALLERAATSGQVVVLGDDDDVVAWASGLGDRAAVRTI